MEDLQKLIENSTHQITDENLNKWKVIELSDLEEIMQAYHESKVKTLGLFSVSQRSELLAFKRFISKTPQAELEYYSDEEFTDLYLKANCG